MVDAGENCSVTVKREFTEEADKITDPARKTQLVSMTQELFANGTVWLEGAYDPNKAGSFILNNAWPATATVQSGLGAPRVHCGCA